MMKVCTKCQVEQTLDNFSTAKNVCKPCRNAAAREYRLKHAETLREKDKRYYNENRDERIAKNKEYRAQNRDLICENKRAYYNVNKEAIASYHAGRKAERNAQKRERRLQDAFFGIVEAMKVRIHRVLNDTKGSRSWDYIGCDRSSLRTWLEFQFDENMSWDNYASYWQIDHVIPITKFDLSNIDNANICFHWSNVRPLEKTRNLSKSDKIVIQDILEHRDTLREFIKHNGYQTMPEKAWWLRTELRYGKNLEDDFVTWLTKEMGNPQPSS